MFSLKSSLRSIFPVSIYGLLRRIWRRYSETRYFKQEISKIKCGRFEIECPANHALIGLLAIQPYRDLCVGISAKFISEKYPECTIVDIGANIGDTAAVIATHSANHLVLVEASDYFFEILSRNISRFPNTIQIRKALISDGSEVLGGFHHWGGTASFVEGSGGQDRIRSEKLSDIAGENVRFIKIDTDGYDAKILADSMVWIASAHPAILFENQIKNADELTLVDELYSRLMQIGYTHFIVWDDPGYHLVSTDCLDILKDLNRYLFKLTSNGSSSGICNYDVLCVHEEDRDVYEKVRDWYHRY